MIDMEKKLQHTTNVHSEQVAPPDAKHLLSADWLPSSDVLPKKGVKVRCKLSKDIGLGTTEKILYRMKHNGNWNDYHHLVTHWKPI
jgi:hypothetical protein